MDLLVYPLDTLKTRIQSPSYHEIYKTPAGATQRTLYRGLYQGIGSVILVTIPSSGAFFTTYEALKFTLNKYNPPNSSLYLPQPAIHALSSAGAELVSCAILTPAEVLKQNAQIVVRKGSKRRGRSPTLEVLRNFRQHPSRLFRGYTALAARNLPFTGLQFPLFEHLKKYLIAQRSKSKNGAPVDGIFERARITAFSAAIAGSGAAWITTPIDVIKTRIMLAAAGDESPHGQKVTQPGPRRSGLQVGKDIFSKEGVRGLFRGALLRSTWTAFGSGLYLGCYEGGRFYLEDRRKSLSHSDGDELQSTLSKNRSRDRQVGVGASRSQDTIKKSAWQD